LDRKTVADNDIDTDGRRLTGDRRAFPTPWISRFTLRGQRHRIRRREDLARGRFVDRATGMFLAGVVTMVLFVALDATSTLYILRHGGTEKNPLMATLIERGTGWFLLVKLGPLPFAYLLLSVARYFGWIKWALITLLLVYGALALYHLQLLLRILEH